MILLCSKHSKVSTLKWIVLVDEWEFLFWAILTINFVANLIGGVISTLWCDFYLFCYAKSQLDQMGV